ncbi:MAG: MATE family efflux transporter [Saprospiraceae bacterium]|nr:MATE family efflux transporter [Saprospiraceae bacterium]
MGKVIRLLLLAISGKEKEFTTGGINRAIVLLAVPMILEMVMESLFALVDVFFVSKVGTEAVATVGLTEVVLMIIQSVALGIAMAATAMIARRIGEKDEDGAAVAAIQTLILGLVISVAVGVLCFIYAEDILRLMGGSPELVAQGTTYTRIILGFNGILFFLFLLNAIFRGAGDAAIAMRTLWLANGINIVLDPCLIFGLGPFPELGLTGAAIATTIGRGTGVLYQLYHLFGGKSIIRILRRHLRISWEVLKKLFNVSLGGAAQFLIATASWLFIVRIISLFGDQALAGYTIAIRIIIFTILPAWGMANAAATLVGQNLGAGKPERAEKSVWLAARYNMFFLLAISVIFIIGAPAVMPLFSEDPVVVREGVRGLRIICVGYVAYAYGMVIAQAFNGAGDTRTPTIINFFCFWLMQIPLAYILARVVGMESTGVYWAIAISESILAVVAVKWFQRGKWKLKEI